jgi:uncharacterized membrane protein YjjP (DUF1212 family)
VSASGTPTSLRAPLPEAEQQEITRLCASTGVALMQHGAESALIESLMRRLGIALGVERFEAGVLANSIVLTTLCGGRAVTQVRRVEDRGINMTAVVRVQRAVLDVEAGALGAAGCQARLAELAPSQYPRWLVAMVIGLSCAAFARLARADLPGCAAVLVASGVAMYVRLRVAKLHFSPVVTFFVAAFVASSLASLFAAPLHLGAREVWPGSATPSPVLGSCVLFLVPGFPLINGVSDLVKGYASTGLARLAYATMLVAAAAVGILLSLAVWNRWGSS